MHGKSEPSAASGKLLRVESPKGTGVSIFMCALTEDARAKAEAKRTFLVEGMLR